MVSKKCTTLIIILCFLPASDVSKVRDDADFLHASAEKLLTGIFIDWVVTTATNDDYCHRSRSWFNYSHCQKYFSFAQRSKKCGKQLRDFCNDLLASTNQKHQGFYEKSNKRYMCEWKKLKFGDL